MKISESIGYFCELSEEEAAMVNAIAERDGITPEEAIEKAIKNFLKSGVQTPNADKESSAA